MDITRKMMIITTRDDHCIWNYRVTVLKKLVMITFYYFYAHKLTEEYERRGGASFPCLYSSLGLCAQLVLCTRDEKWRMEILSSAIWSPAFIRRSWGG